jgi:hypothetical protein
MTVSRSFRRKVLWTLDLVLGLLTEASGLAQAKVRYLMTGLDNREDTRLIRRAARVPRDRDVVRSRRVKDRPLKPDGSEPWDKVPDHDLTEDLARLARRQIPREGVE